MRFNKEFFYVVLSTAILGILAIAVAALIKFYSISDKDYYTENITKINYGNGKERLQLNESRNFIGPKADYFLPVNDDDTLVRYRLKGKYGFINIITGEEIVTSNQHDFKYAWSFDHQSGLAAVLSDEMIGFVNRSGNIRITPQYPLLSKGFDDLDCEFKDGYCMVPLKNKKYGLININNELVLSGYDSMEDPEYGFRVIVRDDKYGLADAACNIILEPSVEELSLIPLGVIISDKGKRFLYDFDCRTVLSDHVYDDVSPVESLDEDVLEEDDVDRYAYSTISLNGKVGLIKNKNGSVVIKPVFDEIHYLSDKVFCVKLNDINFLIDKKGNFIKNYKQED
jgi:hypothetical protein